MTLTDVRDQFLDFVEKHTSFSNGGMKLHLRHRKQHAALAKNITDLTMGWRRHDDIVTYLKLQQYDPSKSLNPRQVYQTFREEFLELLEPDETNTPSSSDADLLMLLSTEGELQPRDALPLQSPLDERFARPHRDASPNRARQRTPDFECSETSSRLEHMWKSQNSPTIPESVLRPILADMQLQKIAALRPTSLRQATVIALNFLGPSTIAEIEDFVQTYRIGGEFHCNSVLVATVMRNDKDRGSAHRADEQHLFVHPTLEQYYYIHNEVHTMTRWSYSLTDFGKQCYDSLGADLPKSFVISP